MYLTCAEQRDSDTGGSKLKLCLSLEDYGIMEAEQSYMVGFQAVGHLQGRKMSTPHGWMFPYCWTTELGHFILLHVPYNPCFPSPCPRSLAPGWRT